MRLILIIGLLLGASASAMAEDEVEFLSGAKVRGTIKEIRKEKKEFNFEVQISGRTMLRTYPFSKVHTVTMGGKKYVLTEPGISGTPAKGGANAIRSEAEIIRLIEKAGQTPPDWFDGTPLEFPKTLDLSWPLKPPGEGWNNQVNMGQYIWDIINPNPDRWKSGIRLVHHMMSLHQSKRKLLQRDMATLGGMYFNLLQDYPRAAYWLRQARLSSTDGQRIMLAECYWRMGSKKMANEILAAKRLPMSAIKLLGDMGQTDRALQLADAFVRSGRNVHEAYLLAGDACRQAGMHNKAIKYYEKVLAAKGARNENYRKRFLGRANDSIIALNLITKLDLSKVRDATYSGTAQGYNGTIQVEVKVAGGHIADVRVIKHKEKQFYAALTDTIDQILKKQSVEGIDATSRATITSQAIVNATAKALGVGAK